MPKKTTKEDVDDEYEMEPEDNEEELDENEDEEEEEFDEEEDEKEELIIEQDTEREGCIIDQAIEDDKEYFESVDETEIPTDQNMEIVSKENRISLNRLTKYEMVRILGERTKQLTMGAKPLIKNHQGLSYDKIAEQEFILNMIPYKIRRPLPNGKFELWSLDELSKEHLLSLLE
jgi:DNA-directed RNA polymerase subunit K/omega